MTRNLTTTLTGIVAILSSIATTVLSILLTAYLTSRRQKVTSLAVVAIVLQCIAICTTALLILSHCKEGSRFGLAGTRRGRNCCFLLSCLVVEFVAAATTGVMLGWTYNKLEYLDGLVVGQEPTSFMLVIIVVYGLASLAQIIFLICLMWVRQPVMEHNPIQHLPAMSVAIRSISRPATPTTVHSTKSRQASLSRPPSAAPSGRSSRQSSLHNHPTIVIEVEITASKFRRSLFTKLFFREFHNRSTLARLGLRCLGHVDSRASPP